MTNTSDAMDSKPKPQPIEMWLTQKNMEVSCTVAREDETTTELDVQSLSIRGAQREMTGWALRMGYEPVGRWVAEVEPDSGGWGETYRRFRPTAAATWRV